VSERSERGPSGPLSGQVSERGPSGPLSGQVSERSERGPSGPLSGQTSTGDPARVRLVVLYGGRSAEHEVSCVSAVHVLKALDPSRYDVLAVGITQDGHWVVNQELASSSPQALPAALEARGEEIALRDVTDERTVVFPVLHGPLGEDGTMQGLLEQLDLPYVGPGVLASAVAMDKAMAKSVLAQAGLPQPRHLVVRDDQRSPGLSARVAAELGWPVFVKPANLGSSVGVSKASSPEALATALDQALSYDELALVEEAIVGREIEVAVLGNRTPDASVPGEVVAGREFYDYEDKYLGDSARLLIPAPLDADATAIVRDLAVRAFGVLRCEGMARVDFFYEEGGRGFLVNEVNTIPGFTPISMYPKLWAASGVDYPALIDRLVALAIERHERRRGRIGRARGGPPDT
jgi:D-alanine-D-alanine ligase